MPTVFPPEEGPGGNLKRKSSSKKEINIALTLSSFILNPDVRFESQNKDEKIILLVRSHPITQIPWILLIIFLIFLPLPLNFLLSPHISILKLIFINFFWYCLIFTISYINILNYIYNIGLVTNHRVCDIDYHSVLYKEVNATPLSKIEDLTTKTGGFIGNLFNFGDVFVQTAATHQNIELKNVPRPSEIASLINDVMIKDNE